MYKLFTLVWEATFSRANDSSSSASAISLAPATHFVTDTRYAVEIVSCTYNTAVADRQLEIAVEIV